MYNMLCSHVQSTKSEKNMIIIYNNTIAPLSRTSKVGFCSANEILKYVISNYN